MEPNDQNLSPEVKGSIKEELEIAELKQRLKWEPIKSYATYLGVAVVVLGLAVERYNVINQRNYEIEQRAHVARISAMSRISSEVTNLCQETFRVIRGHDRIRALGPVLSSTIGDKIKELAKNLDSVQQSEIEHILNELQAMQKAFASQRDDYRYWIDALSLEGKWLVRKQSPTPDFTLYFDQELSNKWSALTEEMLSQIGKEFSILGDSNSDEGKVRLCIEYATQLENKIAIQNQSFITKN